MYHKYLNKGKLLNYEGLLNEAGYAYSLVKEYSRKDIKLKRSRIKEWDYYGIVNDEFGFCFTVSDLSLVSLVSINFLDFKKKKFHTKSDIKVLSLGKLNLPSSSLVGDIYYKSKNFIINFINDGNDREIKGNIKNFFPNKDLEFDIIISEKIKNSMVIVTPFNKKGQFYYNQKINNLLCNGFVKIGNDLYSIKDNYGVFDWGRGVWPRKVIWYWGTCSFKEGNDLIGFNLGYGFGDLSNATENMLFINDEVIKYDDIKFYFRKGKKKKEIDYNSPIKIYSESKDIDLVFTPILDRHEDTNAIIIASYQHQIFGKYSGAFKLKDGKEIKIEDKIGFMERIINKW